MTRKTSGKTPAVHLANAYLRQRTQLGVKFGLETMEQLMDALGRPERASPSLLIAGTNGKGSVAAYVDAALRAGGRRVGRYTSPHLVRVNERIAVDGRAIGDAALARALLAVREAAARLVKAGRIPAHPTYFEAVTAAAFVHFRWARIDVAVLEVGLGGRLDATNVADPLVSAIVSIDYDHEAFLGSTLEAIAREKAGVMRAGRTTVCGPLPPAARRAVAAEARRRGARLVAAHRGALVKATRTGLRVAWPGRPAWRGLVPLPGRHQRDNLVTALGVLELARAAGLRFRRAGAARGLRSVSWPGRLQLVPGRPKLLLDGAHNPAGARALAAHLRGGPPFVLLFGVMADKDVASVAEPLFALAREVVLTRPRIGRAATPGAIAARTGTASARAHREDGVGRALRLARRLAGPDGLVVVAGSLYLVGAVLALLEPARGARSRA
jgi:dihydrofolate synthase/folylpolyglutamate synthase